MELKFVDLYFATARERELIRQRKESGAPKPWTNDPVFQEWRFCNIYRERDKTTTWYRENVREPLALCSNEKIVFATTAFRWFNRIETGQIILDQLVGNWDSAIVKEKLQTVRPIVTGAYMIKSPTGMNKLDGIIACIENAKPILDKFVPNWGPSLEAAWNDLKTIDLLGGFLAYELVTDLQYTKVLSGAPDRMTWTNAGPGCARGLGWLVDGNPALFSTRENDQRKMLEIMRHLIVLSHDSKYWPQDWEPWTMREPEMWACEFDKYMRAFRGYGLKRRYR